MIQKLLGVHVANLPLQKYPNVWLYPEVFPESAEEKRHMLELYLFFSHLCLLLEALRKGAYNIDRGSENRFGGPNLSNLGYTFCMTLDKHVTR